MDKRCRKERCGTYPAAIWKREQHLDLLSPHIARLGTVCKSSYEIRKSMQPLKSWAATTTSSHPKEAKTGHLLRILLWSRSNAVSRAATSVGDVSKGEGAFLPPAAHMKEQQQTFVFVLFTAPYPRGGQHDTRLRVLPKCLVPAGIRGICVPRADGKYRIINTASHSAADAVCYQGKKKPTRKPPKTPLSQ